MQLWRCKNSNHQSGQSLVEILVAMGILAILMPALLTAFVSTREGRVQMRQRVNATTLLQEAEEAARSVRENGWSGIATPGTYHPSTSGSSWSLANGTENIDIFTRSLTISNVMRNNDGQIVSSGGRNDPSTKKIDVTVGWSQPRPGSVTSSFFLTRYLDNLSYLQTTQTDFEAGTMTQSAVNSASGGEVQLSNNNKAKWCSPSFASTTIDLPDGPPVAVAATASATNINIPNDVFVATAPHATTSTKLAYATVPANVDPPTASLQGTFTLDPAKYSSPGLVPAGVGFTNDFATNAVKYYRSSGGNLYALLATTMPNKEVIAVQIKSGTNDTFQDPINKIYQYKTFFNTRRYQGNATSLPNQDHSPYGYGVASLDVLGDRAYAISGGYLYVIDLSSIDSKNASSGLDMVGCRIEIDGTDCNPTTSRVRKYGSGDTGTSWDAEQQGQQQCMDGGAVQKYADNDVFPIRVGSSTYVYVAVGSGADPELNIVNVTAVPHNSSSPTISNSSCGRISGGNSGWKRISQLDFNSQSGTQESSNSVFGRSDGTRAYIASNGGVDGNNNGAPDSKQFYVVDTTNKSSPRFLSGTASSGALTGFYDGDSTNIQTFPRRSLTVLNGLRAVIVGRDGFPNDAIQPNEYQVLNIDNEVSPSYCGGLSFPSGFNDLTSVTEADFDNFVYMVVNTDDNELKIIQGGPDGTYIDVGTFESNAFDAGVSTVFNRYTATFDTPANTTLQFQFAGADAVAGSCTNASYNFVGPDGTADTFYTNPTAAIWLGENGNYQNPGRCFKYKVFLQTTDFNATPVLYDMSVNYSP